MILAAYYNFAWMYSGRDSSGFFFFSKGDTSDIPNYIFSSYIPNSLPQVTCQITSPQITYQIQLWKGKSKWKMCGWSGTSADGGATILHEGRDLAGT